MQSINWCLIILRTRWHKLNSPVAFIYKRGANRQRFSAPFRILGRLLKIVTGSSSFPILFSLCVSRIISFFIWFLLQFKQFQELISFVLFRVARFNMTSVFVHLLVGFSWDGTNLLLVKELVVGVGCISALTSIVRITVTAAPVDGSMDFGSRQAWVWILALPLGKVIPPFYTSFSPFINWCQ